MQFIVLLILLQMNTNRGKEKTMLCLGDSYTIGQSGTNDSTFAREKDQFYFT